MIKLAIVLDDPGYGGAFKVAKDVGAGLDKLTFEVRYYFLCKQPESPPEGTFLGDPGIVTDYSLKSYLRLAYLPRSYEKSFSLLNEALSDFGPDTVHFHTHTTLLPLLRGIHASCPRAQLVYTDHSQRLRPGELSPIKQYLMSKAYRRLFRPAHMVYVSCYAYRTAHALGYSRRDRCWLVANTISTEKFKPGEDSPSDIIKIVYLSRIHPAKGHQLLLDAWHQLPKCNNVSLHLYGTETDGGSIRGRIQRESFPNPVSYEGATSSPETVLQQAQIGVFPSFREGLPLALLEMMACGLPVVASDIPEIRNVVTDGKDGLLYPSNKATNLASQLLRLINDKSLRVVLGKQARLTVEHQYSEPIALKYNQLYQKLIQKADE